LTQAGALVDVIVTRSAAEFVRPLAFQALTHRPVVQDLWSPVGPAALDHVTMARSADLLVVAPITADSIARMAIGRADDALTTTALATRAPIVVVPAMEPNMWSHDATQANVRTLKARGVAFIGPEPGRMASGIVGLGRMAEPEVVLDAVRWRMARTREWAARRVLVTAGPTREPLDPVRYLSNYSTGKMGMAIAVAARNRGAHVDLVHGPVSLDAAAGIDAFPVTTADEMCRKVLDLAPYADALVMTAAVADYRPASMSDHKLKKTKEQFNLPLVRTADILLEVDRLHRECGWRCARVGFAAETRDLLPSAARKLREKGLDLIVANSVPETFGAEAARVSLIDASTDVREVSGSKAEIAEAILDRISALWSRTPEGQTEVSP
jgi:phosphopantothenoylcysteine decarboxylase/phosphopantothenate--cysteine ligase